MANGIHLSFDLDGTIADSLCTTLKIINSMITDRQGQLITKDVLKENMGLGGPALITKLLGTVAIDANQDISEFRQLYAASAPSSSVLYPEVKETLTLLTKRGYSLSLCSNKAINLCNKILDDTGIKHFFPVRIGGEHTHKPNIDHWTELAKLIGNPTQVYYIGDSHVDQQFAEISGMNFIYANYGYGNVDSSLKVCYTIKEFKQLQDIFQ